jgi:hypothetical protein
VQTQQKQGQDCVVNALVVQCHGGGVLRSVQVQRIQRAAHGHAADFQGVVIEQS